MAMHKSIPLPGIELVNISPTDYSPLISKCQIKVCYVGDEPNRNRTIISKDTALKMAPSLRGAAIVGNFHEDKKDFGKHDRSISIKDGEFVLTDETKPYGFVDLNAPVWFQKFEDDDQNVHEYLMTEGYLWTGQYPEAQRIIDKGNNQSMELDENFLSGSWTKDNNGNPQFFIINEAIISKLCILNEDEEPCFEGASITKVQFSLDEDFKIKLFSMMNDIKEILSKGGTRMFTTYAVTIGDSLWNALYSHIDSTNYHIVGVYEDENQKYAVLQNNSEDKFSRLNFSWTEEGEFTADAEMTEIEFTAEAQFTLADIEAFEAEFNKVEEEPVAEESVEPEEAAEEVSEVEETPATESEVTEVEPVEEPAAEEEAVEEVIEEEVEEPVEKIKVSYNLDDVIEYAALREEYDSLSTRYAELETNYNNNIAIIDSLNSELESLRAFKLEIERERKEAMIKSFYMLSDEDKADVVANIDNYSIDDIEAKLSIICVRNKVNFNLDENTEVATVFNLNSVDDIDDDPSMPEWLKATLAVEKAMKD